MLPIIQEIKTKNHTTSEARKFLRSARYGDYLIKIGKNNKRNWCGSDQQYIDYTYLRSGWFSLSCRKDAQWFSGIEAQEFIKDKRGFTIVKRIK